MTLDHFAFESKSRERLDLFGSLVSWSDTTRTGVVKKEVVKRAGAIWQRVGAPPRSFEFRCVFQGPDARANYRRVVEVVLDEPEGKLTHPRFGVFDAVVEEVGASETPGVAEETVEFTLKMSEAGLKTPPKPAPSALGQQASATGASVASRTAASGVDVSAAGGRVAERATGILSAIQAAETGLGTLLDVDASLAALDGAVAGLDALPDVPQLARREAFLTLAQALQARNSFTAGRPPLVRYRVDQAGSLSALMQRLYGGRANDERDLCLRLNTIRTPHAIPAGTVLLITDPAAPVVAD